MEKKREKEREERERDEKFTVNLLNYLLLSNYLFTYKMIYSAYLMNVYCLTLFLMCNKCNRINFIVNM